MRRDIFTVAVVFLLTITFSFFLKNEEVSKNQSFIINRIFNALEYGEGILFVSAGIFTFQGTFRSKILGGSLGLAFKLFSLGLIWLGLQLIQIPVIGAFNLWNSFYYTSN